MSNNDLEVLHKGRWQQLVGSSAYSYKKVEILENGDTVSTWIATNDTKITLTIKNSVVEEAIKVFEKKEK